MTYVSENPENVNNKLAAALDAATLVRDNAPHHRHYDFTDVLTGELLHCPDCPHCAFRKLWHRYTAALNDEIEDRAAALYQWVLLDVSPRERAAVIQRYERALEAAALANFDLDLSVMEEATPRQRLEIGAAFERAKRELDIARYIPPQRKKVPNGKDH